MVGVGRGTRRRVVRQAFARVHAALHDHAWLLPTALRTVAYGAVYVVFHDGLVHRRVPMRRPAARNLRRIVQAHPLHHAVRTREGALSVAFLHAPDPRALRHYVRRRRAVARADGRRDEREEPYACRS
jgi:hypothetical protein